jgi:hypothetical protein
LRSSAVDIRSGEAKKAREKLLNRSRIEAGSPRLRAQAS